MTAATDTYTALSTEIATELAYSLGLCEDEIAPEPIAERIARLVEIVDEHRVAKPRLDGEWLVWDITVSEQTMAKFVSRAKSAGYRSLFCRDGRFGLHIDALGEV
jgi:hypothetical protein